MEGACGDPQRGGRTNRDSVVIDQTLPSIIEHLQKVSPLASSRIFPTKGNLIGQTSVLSCKPPSSFSIWKRNVHQLPFGIESPISSLFPNRIPTITKPTFSNTSKIIWRRASHQQQQDQQQQKPSEPILGNHSSPQQDEHLNSSKQGRDTSYDKELFGTTSLLTPPSSAVGTTVVTGFIPGGFIVSQRVIRGPIILMPDAVMSWTVPPEIFVDTLRLEHVAFFSVVTPKPDFLLIGTGKSTRRNFQLQKDLRNMIGVEYLDSARAAATFNAMVLDGRRAVAVLWPRERER